MIAKIVIGAAKPGEVFVSGDVCPAVVRHMIQALHRDALPAVVIATWAPLAVDETIRIWEVGEECYARIFLRGNKHDVVLSSLHDPAWLNHFSIGDLLMHGEFDLWLSGSAQET